MLFLTAGTRAHVTQLFIFRLPFEDQSHVAAICCRQRDSLKWAPGQHWWRWKQPQSLRHRLKHVLQQSMKPAARGFGMSAHLCQHEPDVLQVFDLSI